MNSIRLMTLNIGNPSIERARQQVSWIDKRNEDIFVLTETKNSEGCRYIEEYFTQYGYDIFTIGSNKKYFVYFPKSSTNDLGVMIISKIPIQNTYTIFPNDDIYYTRFVGCDISYDNTYIRVMGIYVPSRDRSEEKISRKKNFCIEVARHIKELGEIPAIICGDLNILDRNHIPKYPTFFDWEYNFYDFFSKVKYSDVYRYLYPNEQEYSWVGRTNDGYRYDYFFVSNDLLLLTSECSYLHETRNKRLTDHSAVIINLL